MIEQFWTIRQIRDGEVIWEMKDRPNLIVDEGEKAIVDIIYRKNADLYFIADLFYVGLYKGVVSEDTILSTIPNEPSGNGYSRQSIERSVVGWPTIEKDEGDWRVISKTVTITADGGDIGPVSGAFICTSIDNTGVLLGAIAMTVENTVLDGTDMEFEIRAKQK